MGIFNAMVEALVIFKIVFDLMVEIGMLLYRGTVALVRMIIAAIKQYMADKQESPQVSIRETVNDEDMEETI